MWVLRQYGTPVILAICLHALAFMALEVVWAPAKQEFKLVPSEIVRSSLLVLEVDQEIAPGTSKSPGVSNNTQQKVLSKTKTALNAANQRADVIDKVNKVSIPSIDDNVGEHIEGKQMETFARTSFFEALEQELEEARIKKEKWEVQQVVSAFRYGIYERIVSNWSRPPSARNGMEAKLLVELIPTGEVMGVTLIDGSDSVAFDQSAEAAVRKSRRFKVPEESELFESHFRRFTLLFRPEDLIR